MDKEIWKDIKGYEGIYQVSNLSRLKSLERIVTRKTNGNFLMKGRILKLTPNKTGYITTSFWSKGNYKTISLHRMVAIAFIPNPENKRYINHKNGNPSDNRIENLEWCTQSENIKHAYRVLKATPSCIGKYGKDHPVSKPINQLSITGKFIKEWECARLAYRELSISYKNISLVCKNKRISAGGFKWEFV